MKLFKPKSSVKFNKIKIKGKGSRSSHLSPTRLLAVIAFVVMVLGLGAVVVLSQTNLDNRQQASTKGTGLVKDDKSLKTMVTQPGTKTDSKTLSPTTTTGTTPLTTQPQIEGRVEGPAVGGSIDQPIAPTTTTTDPSAGTAKPTVDGRIQQTDHTGQPIGGGKDTPLTPSPPPTNQEKEPTKTLPTSTTQTNPEKELKETTFTTKGTSCTTGMYETCSKAGKKCRVIDRNPGYECYGEATTPVTETNVNQTIQPVGGSTTTNRKTCNAAQRTICAARAVIENKTMRCLANSDAFECVNVNIEITRPNGTFTCPSLQNMRCALLSRECKKENDPITNQTTYRCVDKSKDVIGSQNQYSELRDREATCNQMPNTYFSVPDNECICLFSLTGELNSPGSGIGGWTRSCPLPPDGINRNVRSCYYITSDSAGNYSCNFLAAESCGSEIYIDKVKKRLYTSAIECQISADAANNNK